MAVDWDVEKTISNVRRAAFEGVTAGINRVRNTAIKHIQEDPKTGRIYKRGNVSHQASAPGEAPATDTGRLVQSAAVALDFDEVKGVLSFATAYAAALEFGTDKIAPRPYARRSLEEERDAINEDIQKRVSRAVQS